MKTTTFEFGLRTSGMTRNSLHATANEELAEMDGVQSIVIEGEVPSVTLKIHAEFADYDDAERLHRKLMKKIMKFNGISISDVRTCLTDVFG